MKKIRVLILFLILAFGFTACASIGPTVTKEELKKAEEEFNQKFLQASEIWYPRIHRVGYKLLTSPVPDHGSGKEKFNFVGIGVEELKDYMRKSYGIDKKIQGIVITGIFPGSKAEGLDLKLGDMIEKMDDKAIKSVGAYFKKIRKAEKKSIKTQIYRKGARFTVDLPIEKVYYNAQFFLAPTPMLDAHATFSKINVGIGAIRYCRNDDELAAIMGHELAHVSLKHSLKKLGANIGTSIGYGILAGVIDAYTFQGAGNALLNPAQEATQAKISQQYEREADYFGMQHAFHSGYNIQNGSKVFARLATDAPGFTVLAQILASHPMNSERFLRIEKMIEEFKTKYPEKFSAHTSQDWELIVPVQAGESMNEALERLLQSQKINAAAVVNSTTNNVSRLNQELERKKKELIELEQKIAETKTKEELILDPALTTSGTNTATLASPGKGQASVYSASKKL